MKYLKLYWAFQEGSSVSQTQLIFLDDNCKHYTELKLAIDFLKEVALPVWRGFLDLQTLIQLRPKYFSNLFNKCQSRYKIVWNYVKMHGD